MAAQDHSLINHNPPTISSTYHLRILFYQYEQTFLLEHLHNYLKQIQRNSPQFTPNLPNMNIHHSLIQFQSVPLTRISAYQLFPINVRIIHSFNPSQISFLAQFENQENLFPQSFQLLHPKQTSGSSTLLALDTETGTMIVPSHHPPHQTEDIEVFSLSISACLESLQFSEAPFDTWRPVEASFGRLHFPSNMSILAALPPVQYPNPLSQPPPALPNQKNLRWTERPVIQASPTYAASRPDVHNPPFYQQMENQPSNSFLEYPHGIRQIPQANHSAHQQFSDIPSSNTTSTRYYQRQNSDIPEFPPTIPPTNPPTIPPTNPPTIPPTIPLVKQPLAPLRPRISVPTPGEPPQLQPFPTSQSLPLAPPVPTSNSLPQRLPAQSIGIPSAPVLHDSPPSYAEANPAHRDYRTDTLLNITSHLHKMSDSSLDNLHRFNALRGHSPLIPATTQPITPAPNQMQSAISEPQAPPRSHQHSQRITPIFTSTPIQQPQGAGALSPSIAQVPAPPLHPLTSSSISPYNPPQLPMGIEDQFHHQISLHDDPAITPISIQDVQQNPKLTVKYPNSGAVEKIQNIRKQKLSDNHQVNSRASLDAMCLLLDKYPRHNQFPSCKHFTSDVPPKEVFKLSPNHQLYMSEILHKMNDHSAPTNLATFLTPFVQFDINNQKYVCIDHLLTLDLIQKIDHLLTNSIIGPSAFKRLKDRFTRTRSSSK